MYLSDLSSVLVLESRTGWVGCFGGKDGKGGRKAACEPAARWWLAGGGVHFRPQVGELRWVDIRHCWILYYRCQGNCLLSKLSVSIRHISQWGNKWMVSPVLLHSSFFPVCITRMHCTQYSFNSSIYHRFLLNVAFRRMSLHPLSWKDLQTVDPDLPLSCLTLPEVGVSIPSSICVQAQWGYRKPTP